MATINCHSHHKDNVKAGFCIDLDMKGARPVATPPIFVYKAYIHIIDSLYLIIYSFCCIQQMVFFFFLVGTGCEKFAHV